MKLERVDPSGATDVLLNMKDPLSKWRQFIPVRETSIEDCCRYQAGLAETVVGRDLVAAQKYHIWVR
jgi:hypothetical protein